MDNSEKKIFIQNFTFDTSTRRVMVRAQQEGAPGAETIILNIDALPQTDRIAFLGALNSLLPQQIRALAIWSPTTPIASVPPNPPLEEL